MFYLFICEVIVLNFLQLCAKHNTIIYKYFRIYDTYNNYLLVNILYHHPIDIVVTFDKKKTNKQKNKQKTNKNKQKNNNNKKQTNKINKEGPNVNKKTYSAEDVFLDKKSSHTMNCRALTTERIIIKMVVI